MDKSFILKRVQDEWMKIGIEFNKRLDSELPFFYSSTVHDRFYEGEQPDFNQKPSKEPQQQRVPQHETQYGSRPYNTAMQGICVQASPVS